MEMGERCRAPYELGALLVGVNNSTRPDEPPAPAGGNDVS